MFVFVRHKKLWTCKRDYYPRTLVWKKTIICNLSMYRCTDLFAAAPSSSILNAAVLLITRTASKILFDQFSSCRYKMEEIVPLSLSNSEKHNKSFLRTSSFARSTQSVRVKKISLYAARFLSWCEWIFAVPWGFVSPCYTALGTREINEISLSEAPGLILSLTMTSSVLVSTPCSEMMWNLGRQMLKHHHWITCKVW